MFKLFFGTSGINADLQQKINDLVPSIIYIYDVNNKKLNYVNKRITDILGYGFEEINTWDDHLAGLVFVDDKELVKKELERVAALNDNETHTYNSRLNHKKGDWRYFRTTGSVLRRGKDSTPESYLFIAEDITHTLESEAEVRAADELISETEELLQFGTWSQDAVNNKLYWSAGLYKLFGYTPPQNKEEISLDFYLKHVLISEVDALKQKITSSIEHKTDFEHIYTITTGANHEKIVSTKGKAVKDENDTLIKFIGTTRDVTEQINAYRQLYKYKQITLERERFLESGSWEVDVQTGKITWSEGMYRLFGYEPPEDIAASSLTLDFLALHQSPEEAKHGKEKWAKSVKESNNFIHEHSITTTDNKIKRLETYGKILRGIDGKAEKVIGITKDITQLKDYERQLERRLAELERSNKELEEFAYIASHDLQEPLRKISTFGSRIKAEGDMGDDNKAYLTRMLVAAENMKVLINNLLEFSRVTQRLNDFENTDISKILEDVKTELELEIEETGTVINAGSLPWLEVIPLQIKQLFSNLILNAIKFRKQGTPAIIGVDSILLTDQEKTFYNLQVDWDYYKINITDNGIGFEQEYAEKIFKIFQRLHGKAEYPGTGVGLAICRKITDNHFGKLFATGLPGQGSTFTVILPVKIK